MAYAIKRGQNPLVRKISLDVVRAGDFLIQRWDFDLGNIGEIAWRFSVSDPIFPLNRCYALRPYKVGSDFVRKVFWGKIISRTKFN